MSMKRTRAISTDWMKLSFEELGKIEVRPGMTLETFYEKAVRQKCCENTKAGRFCCEGFTVSSLAQAAGMSRERFTRNVLPKLKVFDFLYPDIKCSHASPFGGCCGWILRNAEGTLCTLEEFCTPDYEIKEEWKERQTLTETE